MKQPMILHWLARRSGLSEGQAELVWKNAIRSADAVFDRDRSAPEYWGYVVDSLRAHMPARCGSVALPACGLAPAPSLDCLAEYQLSAMRRGLLAWLGLSTIASRAWQNLSRTAAA